MKLLLCTHKDCHDVIRLVKEERTCACGRTKGHYINDREAVYTGRYAQPLVIEDLSLIHAIHHRDARMNKSFAAYVPRKDIHSFIKQEEAELFDPLPAA